MTNLKNHRRFKGGRLIVASHNPGKVREIKALLDPFSAEVISAGELSLPEPEETGTTFVANAELKARAAAEEAPPGDGVEDPNAYTVSWRTLPAMRWRTFPAMRRRTLLFGMC